MCALFPTVTLDNIWLPIAGSPWHPDKEEYGNVLRWDSSWIPIKDYSNLDNVKQWGTMVAPGFSDPDEALGMAHFCEHMLFMGTKKYPQEGKFEDFVSYKISQQNRAQSDKHSEKSHSN